MTDEKKDVGAADTAGSPADNAMGDASANANTGKTVEDDKSGDGKTDGEKSEINLDDYVAKVDYEELEKKLGTNSEELGKLRKFVEEVYPLMTKLQDQPEVIEAIMAGKLDSKLAQEVMEGKIKLDDATEVAQANAEVKKDLGDKKYEKFSAEDIEKLIVKKLEDTINPVIEKLGKSEKNFNKALTESEERREFEDKVNGFIKNTSDFQDHAADIDKWFEENPDQFDIEVAYYAVKGKKTVTEAKKEAEVAAAEEAKNVAANAGGGGSQGGDVSANPDVLNDLFGSGKNPNA